MCKVKLYIVFLLELFLMTDAYSALPPRYQNEIDLKTIVEYIYQHQVVLSSLKAIDLTQYAVYYANNCKAVFKRKSGIHPPGWVGPASPLEFSKSNCPTD
jgi:hypothetical protein